MIYNLLDKMVVIAEQMDTILENASGEDIKDLLAWVNQKDLAPVTRADYRISLKRFYKWYNGGERPEKVEWISTQVKGSRKNRVLP